MFWNLCSEPKVKLTKVMKIVHFGCLDYLFAVGKSVLINHMSLVSSCSSFTVLLSKSLSTPSI